MWMPSSVRHDNSKGRSRQWIHCQTIWFDGVMHLGSVAIHVSSPTRAISVSLALNFPYSAGRHGWRSHWCFTCPTRRQEMRLNNCGPRTADRQPNTTWYEPPDPVKKHLRHSSLASCSSISFGVAVLGFIPHASTTVFATLLACSSTSMILQDQFFRCHISPFGVSVSPSMSGTGFVRHLCPRTRGNQKGLVGGCREYNGSCENMPRKFSGRSESSTVRNLYLQSRHLNTVVASFMCCRMDSSESSIDKEPSFLRPRALS